MKSRNSYWTRIVFNGVWINEIIIDPHYAENHSDHMSDELIVKIVETLNGTRIIAESKKNGFSYFKKDPFFYEDKAYRLLFVIEEGKNYIGVVNAFRR